MSGYRRREARTGSWGARSRPNYSDSYGEHAGYATWNPVDTYHVETRSEN